MRILYRNPDNQSLSVMNVTGAKYMEDEKLLVFYGDDDDICMHTGAKQSDTLVKTLYEEKKLDLTSYGCVYYDWDDEDDDEDDEDDDSDSPKFIFKL